MSLPLFRPGHLLQLEVRATDITGPDLLMLRRPGL